MSNALHKRVAIRRVCRKCGAKLANKPEYDAIVCPKCGWTYMQHGKKVSHGKTEKDA